MSKQSSLNAGYYLETTVCPAACILFSLSVLVEKSLDPRPILTQKRNMFSKSVKHNQIFQEIIVSTWIGFVMKSSSDAVLNGIIQHLVYLQL